MNEMTQDLVLSDIETHSIMGAFIKDAPKVLITKLDLNYTFENSDGYIIAKNSTKLDLDLAHLNNEISRSEFFDTGAVSEGFHYKADWIYWFRKGNEYGAVMKKGQVTKPLDLVRKTAAIYCKSPWSIFDHRVWFTSEADAKLCYLLI